MISELKEIGIGYYEAKILEVLLKEKLDIRELSRKSKVPFGKIYSIIKNMKEKDIIKETNSRPKLVYIEDVSEIIDRFLKERQEKDKKLAESIRNNIINIKKERGEQSRFFEIGTIMDDNKRIQLRAFHEAETEVLQIFNIYHKPSSNRESKIIWEKEIENAVKRGVVFKSIYPKSAVLPPILKRLDETTPRKFHVKRLNNDFTRCDIIDGRKVLIKLVQKDILQFGGIIFIENEKLAENLTRIFNQMWENAE